MDSGLIKSVELNGSNVRVTADKESQAVCIETADEMVHIHGLEQLQTVKSMLYEIIYWWETLARRENQS